MKNFISSVLIIFCYSVFAHAQITSPDSSLQLKVEKKIEAAIFEAIHDKNSVSPT